MGRLGIFLLGLMLVVVIGMGVKPAMDGVYDFMNTTKTDQYYITGDDSAETFRALSWQAQTFTPSITHEITSVELKLYRTNSPGNITVSIRATNVTTGHPTGSDLCNGTTNGSNLTTATTGEWREITFSTGYNLTADTQYAIVVRAPSAGVGHSARWRVDTTSPTYASGNREASSNGGESWSSITSMDFMFKETQAYLSLTEKVVWRLMPYLIPLILIGLLIAYLTGKIGRHSED